MTVFCRHIPLQKCTLSSLTPGWKMTLSFQMGLRKLAVTSHTAIGPTSCTTAPPGPLRMPSWERDSARLRAGCWAVASTSAGTWTRPAGIPSTRVYLTQSGWCSGWKSKSGTWLRLTTMAILAGTTGTMASTGRSSTLPGAPGTAAWRRAAWRRTASGTPVASPSSSVSIRPLLGTRPAVPSINRVGAHLMLKLEIGYEKMCKFDQSSDFWYHMFKSSCFSLSFPKTFYKK